MKKNQIVLLIIGILVTMLSILLWIFCVPNSFPLLYDWSEKVIYSGSKWWLFIITLFPLLFAILGVTFKGQNIQFIFKMIYVLSIYEIFLILISLLTGTIPGVGMKSEIPLTCYLFLPISVIIMVLGIKLKTIPYDSKMGIRFKCTRETEFIWKQTHFFARKVLFPTGFLLFIISAVLSFFHFALVVFMIYIIAILTSIIIIYCYSLSIYKKYMSMKTKLEGLEKNKTK